VSQPVGLHGLFTGIDFSVDLRLTGQPAATQGKEVKLLNRICNFSMCLYYLVVLKVSSELWRSGLTCSIYRCSTAYV
jgi:hypothetical protein